VAAVRLVHAMTLLDNPLMKCELWSVNLWTIRQSYKLERKRTYVKGETVTCLLCLYWQEARPTQTKFVSGVFTDGE
jgi:hypothetical protein